MGYQEPTWALSTLEDRLNELSGALPDFRRRADVDANFLADIENENVKLQARYNQLLRSIMNGDSIDLYPEFELLCWEIRCLMNRGRTSIFNACVVHGSITATSAVVVAIVRCIACVEAAVMTLVGSAVTAGIARIQWMNYENQTKERARGELEMKIERARLALKDNSDIRFSSTAIETFGLLEYQHLQESSIE